MGTDLRFVSHLAHKLGDLWLTSIRQVVFIEVDVFPYTYSTVPLGRLTSRKKGHSGISKYLGFADLVSHPLAPHLL